MPRHRGGQALAGASDLCPHCQGYHWAEPITLRQNSRRNLCSAPSALTLTPLTHSHCQSIFPESKFCVCLLCSAALLPPAPASGPLHCCSLAQNILLPRRFHGQTSPLLLVSAHLSPPQYHPPCHPIKNCNPCLALPSPSLAPTLRFCGFVLFFAKALLPFSHFL